jgi:hypothetical protein
LNKFGSIDGIDERLLIDLGGQSLLADQAVSRISGRLRT